MITTIKHFFPFFAALMLSGPAMAFEVTSPDMTDGKTLGMGQMAKNEHCNGGNASPGLAWKDPPAGTKSFVVTMYDPDAPTGSGFWHWTVYNIPGSATELPTGAGSGGKGLPPGAVQGRTDEGAPGFVGACPPPGLLHHSIVTVTALKVEKLDLPPDASAAKLGLMTGMNSLGKASITATYEH